MSRTTMRSQEQQLRKRAWRALSAEHIRKSRIAALQQELESLERDLASNTKTTQHDLEQLAKSECMSITHQITTKLPRELRDLIYRYLSTRASERIEREYFRVTLDPVTKLYSYNNARWKASHFPEHFWDPQYIGKVFFWELVENYYRTSTFIFNDDPGVMKRFLDTDEMGLGILPRDLVCNVEVHLNAVGCDRGSFCGYMSGVPREAERLQEVLEGFFGLKEGARICIQVFTGSKTEKERDEHCADLISNLISSVQRAKPAGYKVKLMVDEKHEFIFSTDTAGKWTAIHGWEKKAIYMGMHCTND